MFSTQDRQVLFKCTKESNVSLDVRYRSEPAFRACSTTVQATDLLPQTVMWQTHDCSASHARNLQECPLHSGGMHVLAAAAHHVLQPAQQPQRSASVKRAQIPRPQPASQQQRLCRRVRIIPVPASPSAPERLKVHTALNFIPTSCHNHCALCRRMIVLCICTGLLPSPSVQGVKGRPSTST